MERAAPSVYIVPGRDIFILVAACRLEYGFRTKTCFLSSQDFKVEKLRLPQEGIDQYG